MIQHVAHSTDDRRPALWNANNVSAVKSPWLQALCISLAGYALLGKGWAYVGLPPLFIGEVILLIGMLSVFLTGRFDGLWSFVTTPFLMLLVLWGLCCTWPFVGRYGIEALRDAVIWGYAAYAIVVYAYLTAAPNRLSILVKRYRQFAASYPFLIPGIWLFSRFFDEAIPRWPWADAPVIDAKGGDVLVHLAGALAFCVAGLAGELGFVRAVVLACSIGIVGAFNRAGLLAVLAVYAFCWLVRPMNRTLWTFVIAAAAGMTVLAAADIRIELPGKPRYFSFEQLIENVFSIANSEEDGELSGTKTWRLNWWSDIYGYTVNGPYFWTGKGFGINLADDDGYQGTDWEGRLRSPHNGHITMLARAGVPGFMLWCLVHASWGLLIFSKFRHARATRIDPWERWFFFLFAYWIAFIVNTTFDVYLEGPRGGIWFWTLFGVGLASVRIYNDCPSTVFEVQSLTEQGHGSARS